MPKRTFEKVRSGEIRTGQAKNPEICLLIEEKTYNWNTSVSIRDGIISEKVKTPLTPQVSHT